MAISPGHCVLCFFGGWRRQLDRACPGVFCSPGLLHPSAHDCPMFTRAAGGQWEPWGADDVINPSGLVIVTECQKLLSTGHRSSVPTQASHSYGDSGHGLCLTYFSL